jgi:phospholipase/carboxylesterase
MSIAATGASPANARLGLVMLHGRGADAADILGLVDALGLPDIAALAPEAPGRSWWPTSFLAPTAQMEAHVERGLAAIDTALAELEAAGLEPEQIALGGFSQGACLALEYAARRGGAFRAVFGLSGALVGTGDSGGEPIEALYGHVPKLFEYTPRLAGVPVYLGCHERDPHIPLARLRQSEAVLAGLGARVETQIHPGAGHGLTEEDVSALRRYLN